MIYATVCVIWFLQKTFVQMIVENLTIGSSNSFNISILLLVKTGLAYWVLLETRLCKMVIQLIVFYYPY